MFRNILHYITIIVGAFSPSAVHAATIASISERVIKVINLISEAIIAGIMVLFFWNVGQIIFKPEGARTINLLWLIIALFIMVGVWGIIQLLQNTFFPGGPMIRV